MMTTDELAELRDLLYQVLTQGSVLQASVDILPAEIGAAVSDPALTLGAMDQRLTRIESGLATVAKMPVKSAQDFETLRAEITREVTRKVDDAARADGIAWRQREEAVIVRRTVQDQRSVTAMCSAAALMAGLVLFPVLSANVFSGGAMAAWATGHTDRWLAGQDLMKGANPNGWNQFVDAWNEVQRQEAAVQACKGQESLFPDGSLRPCEVVVPKAGAL